MRSVRSQHQKQTEPYRFVKAGTADGEIERPSLALAREYLGWLNFISWPYRAYQWIKYFASKPQSQRAEPTFAVSPSHSPPAKTWDGSNWVRPDAPKPKRKTKGGKVKVVTYDLFLGHTWILLTLLALGLVTILMSFSGGSPFDPRSDIYDTRVGYFLWGSFLTFCGIFYYAWNKRNVAWQDAIPEPRDPNDIPTPEETKRAHNQFRLALAFKHELFNLPNSTQQHMKLGEASMALARARSLDPRVTVVDESEKEPYTYTLDQLASELLYFESKLYSNEAEAKYNAAWTPELAKYLRNDYLSKRTEDLKKSRDAIEKALRYNPRSSINLRQAIVVYRNLDQRKKANELLDHALSLHPDDIELLKLEASR